VQPLAEVDSIGIPSNKLRSQPIEPLQSLFPQAVDKEDVFDIEDDVGPWAEIGRDGQQFLDPLTTETSLQNECGRIVASWNRNSQHALSRARQ
jgi:hypothetical protein